MDHPRFRSYRCAHSADDILDTAGTPDLPLSSFILRTSKDGKGDRGDEVSPAPGVGPTHFEPLEGRAPDGRPNYAAASKTPTSGTTPDFLALATMLGMGLASVDREGTVCPLNESGASLLEALGSANGGDAPNAIIEALSFARAGNKPFLRDTPALSPEARHISVAAYANDDGSGLVAMRDHTEETPAAGAPAAVGEDGERRPARLRRRARAQQPADRRHGLRAATPRARPRRHRARPDPDHLRRGRARRQDRAEPALVRPPPQAHEGDGGHQRPAAARPRAAQLRLHHPQHQPRHDDGQSHGPRLGRPGPDPAGLLQPDQERRAGHDRLPPAAASSPS